MSDLVAAASALVKKTDTLSDRLAAATGNAKSLIDLVTERLTKAGASGGVKPLVDFVTARLTRAATTAKSTAVKGLLARDLAMALVLAAVLLLAGGAYLGLSQLIAPWLAAVTLGCLLTACLGAVVAFVSRRPRA